MAKIIQNKWASLFFSNFLGVFNDNLLKNSVIFISVTWALPHWLTQSQLISIVSACLVLPYIFLSPLGGKLAVVHSRKRVFRFFKLLEIPIMLVACVAFYYQWVLLAAISVLLMGTQSSLYSPSKYSLIRDIGGEEGVSFGSGVFEAMAFLGILTGTVTASVISDSYSFALIVSLFLGVALLGYLVTRAIRATEQDIPDHNVTHMNPIRFLKSTYKFARKHSLVNSAVLGASAFWLIGGMLQMNLVIHTQHVYHASNTTTGLVMACAAVGIATGMYVAGKISGNTVKRGLILAGITLMSALLLILTLIHLTLPAYAVVVFCVAFSGGLFQVPCMSMIQSSDLGRKLGDVIAYLNLITFIFILMGTALFWLVTWITNENSYAVFGAILLVCLLVGAYFVRKSPVFVAEYRALLRKPV